MSLSTKTSESLPTTVVNEKNELASDDPFEVHLEGKENVQNLSTFRKWLIVVVISLGATCVTCASSVVRFIANSRLDLLELVRLQRLKIKSPKNFTSLMKLQSYQSVSSF